MLKLTLDNNFLYLFEHSVTHIPTPQMHKVYCEAFVMIMALIRLPVVSLQFAFAVQTPAVVTWATEDTHNIGAIGHKYKTAGGH